MVSGELDRLGLDSGINFDELASTDVAAGARAYQALADAQMNTDETRRVAGV